MAYAIPSFPASPDSILAACKQCGRFRIPTSDNWAVVAEKHTFADVVSYFQLHGKLTYPAMIVWTPECTDCVDLNFHYENPFLPPRV